MDRVVLRDDLPPEPTVAKSHAVPAHGELRTSNAAATRASENRAVKNAAQQAAEELLPVFEGAGLARHAPAVAKAMCAMRHQTSKHAVRALNDWHADDAETFSSRLQGSGIGMSIQEMNKLIDAVRTAAKAMEASLAPAAAPPRPVEKVKVRTRCGSTELQVTLTAKFLTKPLSEALLVPFLKAHSKRAGVEARLEHVERVELEGLGSIDASLPARDLLAASEASVSIFLQEGVGAAPPAAMEGDAAPTAA